MCGDVNSSSTITSADIIYLINYLYVEGPAPPEACGDVDNFQLTTIRDVFRLVYFIFKGGPGPICPPANGPYVSQPTLDYSLSYNNVFPANQTSVLLDLDMSALKQTHGMTLPFMITVDGVAPSFGTVTFDPAWLNTSSNPNPTGGPAGSILLGFVQINSPNPAGNYELADIELIMPMSGSARPIVLSWIDLPPVESGQPVNYPMLVDDSLYAWQPFLPGAPVGDGSISGVKFRDDDADCDQGLLEPGIEGFLMYLQPLNWIATTDDTGGYRFDFVPAGSYTLQEVQQPWHTQTCPVGPPTYTVVLGAGDDVTGYDFGNQIQIVEDLAVQVAGSRARPGFDKTYGVSCQNVGSVPLAADVKLSLPAEVTYLSSTGGGTYSVGPHEVNWSLGPLAPGSTTLLQVSVQVSVSTPLGTFICATATIATNPPLLDDDVSNNVDTECQEVRGSWDPNEKHVTPPGAGPSGFVFREDTLRYHIDFQNTGTDTAFTVVVRDTVDDDIDLTTIQPGASSHPYVLTISNRELKWTFNNIMLPDSVIDEPGSHGFVEYTLEPSNVAPDGADIPNAAGIYFDFNPPVITNSVLNTICPILVPGDLNSSGTSTSADIILLVNYVFKSGPEPEPAVEAGDINCNGSISSADIILLVNFCFKGGPAPCDPCTEL